MERKLLVLLLLIAMALFSACGGSSGGSDSPASGDGDVSGGGDFLSSPSALLINDSLSDKTKVILEWQSVEDAEKYEIHRSETEGSNFEKLGESAVASFTDDSIEKGHTYYYKVAAVSGDLSSTLSAAVSRTVTLDPPANFTLSSDNISSITLTWDSDDDATEYVVYRSIDSADSFSETTKLSSTVYDDSNTDLGYSYYYQVASVSKYDGVIGDLSTALNSFLVTTGVATGLSASSDRIATIVVSWNKAADSDEYAVFRDGVEIGVATGSSYKDTSSSLIPGKSYTYHVRGLYAKADNISEKVTGSLRDSSSPVLCTISWDKNNDSAVNTTNGGYRIYLGSSSDFALSSALITKEIAYTSGSETPTSTELEFTSAGTYYLKVVAFGNIGGSEFTSSVSEAIIVEIQ